MVKFIECIEHICAVIALSCVFIVAMMQVLEIDAHNCWVSALVVLSCVASGWICNTLYYIYDYLKDNDRNGSKKKTL